jgi:tetratricopeptide (TPR) repeat protein
MIGNKNEALQHLNDTTTDTIAAAAMLRTQILHEAGDFEGAMTFGKEALNKFPNDIGLASAIATLALDLEDVELARQCAARGGEHPEALAASGILELQDGDPETARQKFDRSLSIREHNPRAWIGRGLSALVRSDAAGATADLDRGAQQFGKHIGSWIAAGWAHYLAGDLNAAADRFERALAIDPNFSESHGSLAIIDLAHGNKDAAQRRMLTALRLDRECFSAALVQLLLNSGDAERSRAIVEQAFNTPLGKSGLTITSYLAGLSKPTLH